MRITKKMIRESRIRLDQRVKDLFGLTDDRLVAFIKEIWPNMVTEGETREQLLKVAVLLSIEKCFPDHLTT